MQQLQLQSVGEMFIYLGYYKLIPKGGANQSGSYFCFVPWHGCKLKKQFSEREENKGSFGAQTLGANLPFVGIVLVVR